MSNEELVKQIQQGINSGEYMELLYIQNDGFIRKLAKKYSFIDIRMTVFIIALVLLITISFSCTLDLLTAKWENIYTFNYFEKTGDSIISYMMTYIVPLLSAEFLSFRSIIVNATLYLLIGIMYIRLDLIYFNPIWLLLGYSTYTSDNGKIIISNIKYEYLNQNAGQQLKASYIIDKIYLIRKKDNQL